MRNLLFVFRPNTKHVQRIYDMTFALRLIHGFVQSPWDQGWQILARCGSHRPGIGQIWDFYRSDFINFDESGKSPASEQFIDVNENTQDENSLFTEGLERNVT